MNITGYSPYSVAAQSATVAPSAPLPARTDRPQKPAGYTPPHFVDHYVSRYANGPIPATVVEAHAKNMGIRLIDGHLGLKASYIEAELHDKTPHNPMDIEEIDFNLDVRAGVISVSDVDATLTAEAIIRQKMAPGKTSPIKDLRVTFEPDNGVRVQGKVKALGMSLPFNIDGKVAVNSVGEVTYSLGKAKVAGIGLNGLMKVSGLSLGKVLKMDDPSGGVVARDNNIHINLSQLVSSIPEAIGLNARVRGVSTHLGRLSLTVGQTPEDAQRALDQVRIKEPNYLKARAGHAYIDGFFVRDAEVSIYDMTPGSPLMLTQKGPGERSILLQRGFAALATDRFTELIQDEIGEGGALTNIRSDLTPESAVLKGNLFGAIPIKMDMVFDRTEQGKIKFTPENPKAFGFIPVPESFAQKQVQKLVANGTPHGKGIALDSMSGTDLGYVRRVVHQNGYIVIESGR